jgi:hypothetical protein
MFVRDAVAICTATRQSLQQLGDALKLVEKMSRSRVPRLRTRQIQIDQYPQPGAPDEVSLAQRSRIFDNFGELRAKALIFEHTFVILERMKLSFIAE